MRIQNNIMAMNTHRMYSINNANIQKSAEKLSSGYRINRAGDDAAGLAISEKMRSQIRGLNMASKNSQDAISLVQTAEGALQEVHSMLQRMNELAVQSATGTNQEFDRLQLAKEFDQLKREINDISEQTTFNNMKILDGSLSNEGPVRSAATAGIYATVSEVDFDKAITNVISVDGKDAVVAASGTSEFKIGGSYAAATNASVTVTFKNADGKTGVVSFSATDTIANASDLAGELAAVGSVEIDGISYTITNSDDVLTLSGPDGVNPDIHLTEGIAVSIGGTAVNDAALSDIDNQPGAAAADATNAKTSFNLDVENLRAGDKIVLNDGTTTVEIEVPEGGFADLDAVVASISFTGFTASVNNGKIELLADNAEAATAPSVSYLTANPDANKTTYIEFDKTKMREGDLVSIEVGGTNYTYKWQGEGDSVKNIEETLKANGFDGVSLKGNTLSIEGVASVEGFVPRDLIAEPHGTMRIQVGALENEQLNIEVKSMNTAGLKLDGSNLETQDAAGMAITSTRNAVNIVSEQRALLGAMQNRLEHKISNLDNTAENLQAAEARIRDVDIAKEMTNFTKNNILAQAATAMLAQANAAPQSVLSLLQ